MAGTSRVGPIGWAGGRLTLETGVPVSISDQSGIATLRYAPYIGNQISLFDGTSWFLTTFAEVSLDISALTGPTPYDIFLYNASGTLTLEAVAWTDDTNRATALAQQDFIYVQTSNLTRRYVGTIYVPTAGGITSDTALLRHVWNAYNRVQREMYRAETTDSWSSVGTVWRQMNGSTSNQLDVVVGLEIDPVDIKTVLHGGHGGGGAQMSAGVGLDSTTATATDSFPRTMAGSTNNRDHVEGHFNKTVGIGQHTLTALELTDAAATFYGDDGGTALQSGIYGHVLA